MTSMITEHVKLPGGVTAVLERPGARLVYEVSGDGPAVVLIHGFGLDMRMWDPQVGPLAARFRVVRYDCRGFGASGPLDPAVPYTHAGDLVALLDHLDIGDAVLAGLSFGGRVALQAALADPARVRGLALLDTVLDGVPWDPESARALDEVARRVQARGVRAGREAWLAHPLFAAARERPDLAAALAAACMTTPNILAVRAARASLGDRAFLADCRRRILASRTRITTELARLGLKYAEPQGNFVFFDTGMPLARFTGLMRARNILVGRLFAPYDTWCRITIGTEPEVTAFLEALRAVTAS